MGKVSVLLLTLAAGKGGGEGGLSMTAVYSMRVSVIVGIKKSSLSCRFQCHRPIHIVIISPDSTYLVK